MATYIICIIMLLICIYSIKSYANKLTNGCCGAGGDIIKKIKPSDKNISNYSYNYKIRIEGMTCKNCKMRVENAFNEDSNFYAQVNLKEKYADVRSKLKISNENLETIVNKEGYKVISINEI